ARDRTETMRPCRRAARAHARRVSIVPWGPSRKSGCLVRRQSVAGTVSECHASVTPGPRRLIGVNRAVILADVRVSTAFALAATPGEIPTMRRSIVLSSSALLLFVAL